MKKIKVGDEVIVITGSDKGRRGVVKELLAFNRLIVEGVNVRKKHRKANPQNPEVESGILDIDGSIHASNVALYNAKSKKGEKVSIQTQDSGKRVRVFRSSGEAVDI